MRPRSASASPSASPTCLRAVLQQDEGEEEVVASPSSPVGGCPVQRLLEEFIFPEPSQALPPSRWLDSDTGLSRLSSIDLVWMGRDVQQVRVA